MDINEVIETYKRCSAKVELFDEISLDEDEESNIFINESGKIFFNYKETPYTVNDIEYIKYRKDESYFAGENYSNDSRVVIKFKKNESASFGENPFLDKYGFEAKLNFDENPMNMVEEDGKDALELYQHIIQAKKADTFNKPFKMDGNLLIYVAVGDYSEKELIIPENITEHTGFAFDSRGLIWHVKRIVFPKNMKKVDMSKFIYSKSLEEIVVPKGCELKYYDEEVAPYKVTVVE